MSSSEIKCLCEAADIAWDALDPVLQTLTIIPLVGDLVRCIGATRALFKEVGKTCREAHDVAAWMDDYLVLLDSLIDTAELKNENEGEETTPLDRVTIKFIGNIKTEMKHLIDVTERITAHRKYFRYTKQHLRAFKFQATFRASKAAAKVAWTSLDRAVLYGINKTTRENNDMLRQIQEKQGLEPEMQRNLMDVVDDSSASNDVLRESVMFIADGKPEAALDHLKILTAQVFLAKGLALQGQENLHDAIQMFTMATNEAPEMSGPWFAKGYALNCFHGEATEESLHAFDQCILFDKTHAKAHNNLGVALAHVRMDYPRAEKMFRKAIRLDPNDASAYYNLGHMLHNRFRQSPSLETYEAAKPAKIYYELAVQKGDTNAASNLENLEANFLDAERIFATVREMEGLARRGAPSI